MTEIYGDFFKATRVSLKEDSKEHTAATMKIPLHPPSVEAKE